MEAVVPCSYRGPCTALCFEADAVWWGTGPVLSRLPVSATTATASEDAAAAAAGAALRRRARVLPPGEVMHSVCAAMGSEGPPDADAPSPSSSLPCVLAVGSHNAALVSAAGAGAAASPLEVRAALRVAVPIATGGAAWYVPASSDAGDAAVVVVAVLTLDSFVTVFGVDTAGGAAPRVLLRAGMGLGSVGCMSGAFALRRGAGEAAALSVYAGGMGGRVWGQTYAVVGAAAAAAAAAAPVALDGHASTGHVRAVAAQTLRCGTTYVATACDDRSVALWRVPLLPSAGEGAEEGKAKAKAVAVCCVKGAHAARVWTVALAFPYLASGGEDGVVCLRRVAEDGEGGGGGTATLLASHRADSGSWAAALRASSSSSPSSDGGTSADLAFGSLSGDVRVVLGGGGGTHAAPPSQATRLLCPLRQQLPRGSAAVRVARCSGGGGGGTLPLCYAASGDVLYAMRMGCTDGGVGEEAAAAAAAATPVCHFGGTGAGGGGGGSDGATCVASAGQSVAVGTAGGLLHIACVEATAAAAAVTPQATLRVGRKVVAVSVAGPTAPGVAAAVACAASAGGDVVVCEVPQEGSAAGRCWRFAPADTAAGSEAAAVAAAAGGKRRRVGGGGVIPTAVWGSAGGDGGSWALAVVGFKDGTLRFFAGRGEGGSGGGGDGGGDGVLTAWSDVAERLAEGDSSPIVSIVHDAAGGTVVVASEGGSVAVYDVSSSSVSSGAAAAAVAPPSRVSLVRTGFKDLVGAALQQQQGSSAAAARLLLLRFHAGRFSLSDAARGEDELDGAGVRGGSKAVSRRTLGVAWGVQEVAGGAGVGVGAATTVGVSCVQESKEVLAAVLVAPGCGGGGGGGGAATTGSGVSVEDGAFLRCDVEGMSAEASSADGVFVAGGDDGSAVCVQAGGDSTYSSAPPRVSRVLLPRHTSVVKAAAACVLRAGGAGVRPRPVYAACGGNEQLSVWAADDGGGTGGTGAGGLLFAHAPDANDDSATLQRLLCLGRLRDDALVAGASDGTLRVFSFSAAAAAALAAAAAAADVVAVEASPAFGSCLSLACVGGVVVVGGSCGRLAAVRVGAAAADAATLAVCRPHQVGVNCLSVQAAAAADAVLRVVSGGDDQAVAVWDLPVAGGAPPLPRRVAEAAVFSAGARAVRWVEGGGGGTNRFVALGSDQRVVLCGVEGGALRVVCGVVTSVLRPTSLAVQVVEEEEGRDGRGGGALRVVVAGKGCEVLKIGLRSRSKE